MKMKRTQNNIPNSKRFKFNIIPNMGVENDTWFEFNVSGLIDDLT